MIKIMYCNNCEQQIADTCKYCPECGQKVIEKITVKVLLSNFINNYLSVDSRFFKSFLPLIIKPGYTAEVFIKGKRLKYLHPVQFYLFVSLVFFLVLTATTGYQIQSYNNYIEKGFEKDRITITKNTNNSDKKEGANIVYDFDHYKLDSLILKNASTVEKIKILGYKETDSGLKYYVFSQMLEIYEQSGRSILNVFFDIIPVALFFFLPLFALLLKIFFYRNNPYSHHLIFSFYFFAFVFLLYTIYLILNSIFNIPFAIILLITSIYLLIGIKRFYRKKVIHSLIKTTVIIIINLFLLLPFTAVVAFVTVLIY